MGGGLEGAAVALAGVCEEEEAGLLSGTGLVAAFVVAEGPGLVAEDPVMGFGFAALLGLEVAEDAALEPLAAVSGVGLGFAAPVAGFGLAAAGLGLAAGEALVGVASFVSFFSATAFAFAFASPPPAPPPVAAAAPFSFQTSLNSGGSLPCTTLVMDT